jgi:hypothetical protein
MQRRFLRMACLLVVACAMSMSPTGASMTIPRLAGRAQRNLASLRGSRCATAAQNLGSRWPSISILEGEAGAGVRVVRMVLRGGSDRQVRGNMDDDDDDDDDDDRPHHRSMEVEDVVDGQQQQDAAPEGATDAADDEDSVIFLDEDERVEEQWSGEGAAQESLPVTDPNAPNFGEEGYGSSEFSRLALYSPSSSSSSSSSPLPLLFLSCLLPSPPLSSFLLFFLSPPVLSLFPESCRIYSVRVRYTASTHTARFYPVTVTQDPRAVCIPYVASHKLLPRPTTARKTMTGATAWGCGT